VGSVPGARSSDKRLVDEMETLEILTDMLVGPVEPFTAKGSLSQPVVSNRSCRPTVDFSRSMFSRSRSYASVLKILIGANNNRGGRDRAGIRLTVGTKLDGHRLRVSGQSHRLCPADRTGLVRLPTMFFVLTTGRPTGRSTPYPGVGPKHTSVVSSACECPAENSRISWRIARPTATGPPDNWAIRLMSRWLVWWS
jgi:hypothetical protein